MTTNTEPHPQDVRVRSGPAQGGWVLISGHSRGCWCRRGSHPFPGPAWLLSGGDEHRTHDPSPVGLSQGPLFHPFSTLQTGHLSVSPASTLVHLETKPKSCWRFFNKIKTELPQDAAIHAPEYTPKSCELELNQSFAFYKKAARISIIQHGMHTHKPKDRSITNLPRG